MTRGLRVSRAAVMTHNQAAITATDKYFGGMATLQMAGTSMTPAQIKAVLQAENDGMVAVDSLRSALAHQIALTAKASKRAHAIRQGLNAYVLANYGAQGEGIAMLKEFQFTVPKPKGAKKVQAKLRGQEAAKATREARHTMGTRQKKAIKGKPSSSS